MKKSQHDKFYTTPTTASMCVNLLKPYCSKIDMFIEPSAGNGVFEKFLPNNSIYLDIEPEEVFVQRQDWFKFIIPKVYRNVCVVGNPPFGNRNHLSQRFIKHTTTQSNVSVVAFILPMVYKKHTLQNIFPYRFALAEELVLPNDSFLLEGVPYHVPCVFQIWIKDYKVRNLRVKKVLDICSDFDILPKSKSYVSDFFVFGAAPSNLINASDVVDSNRGYYLKAKINKEELKENFRLVNWQGNSSVSGGVAWLTKHELITQYNQLKGVEVNDQEQPVSYFFQ